MDQIVYSEQLGMKPAGEKKSVWSRIWKYKLHYFIIVPALLLLFLFKGIPLIQGVWMAFVDYKVIKGLFHSEPAGWSNITALWNDPAYVSALSNTLVIKLEYIAGSGILALLFALALSSIRGDKWKMAFSTLLLAPVFIPSVVLAYTAMIIVSPEHSPLFHWDVFVLGDNAWYQPMLVSVEIVKTVGIPVLLAAAAIRSGQSAMKRGGTYLRTHIVPALRAIAAFALIQLSLLFTTDFELAYSLLNPLIYESGDTLETYMFRVGFIQAQFSLSSAAWFVQTVVQLICTLLAYLLIRGLFTNDLFHKLAVAKTDQVRGGNFRFVGAAATWIFAIVLLVLVFIVLVYPFTLPSASSMGLWDLVRQGNFVLHILLDLLAVIGFLFITLTLAFPLTVKDLPGRGLYKLLLLLLMTVGAATLPEFMLYRNLGMVNTLAPNLLSGMFSLGSVFVLKSIFNSKYSEMKEQAANEGRGELHALFYLFIPKIWKPLLALGVLQFVTLWGSYMYSLIYMARADLYSPAMLFKSIALGGNELGIPPGDPVIMRFGAIVSLPCLILLLLFGRWLTSEVLTSQARKR